MKTVLAFDFGASTGRAIKARFDGENISYEEIHRFENTPKTVDGHICHDVDMIFSEIKQKSVPSFYYVSLLYVSEHPVFGLNYH